MPELVLNIIKVGDTYRALIHVGEDVNLIHGKVVFKRSKFTSGKAKKLRESTWQLKEEAQNWARKHNIPFVANLDVNPYEEQRFLEKT